MCLPNTWKNYAVPHFLPLILITAFYFHFHINIKLFLKGIESFNFHIVNVSEEDPQVQVEPCFSTGMYFCMVVFLNAYTLYNNAFNTPSFRNDTKLQSEVNARVVTRSIM